MPRREPGQRRGPAVWQPCPAPEQLNGRGGHQGRQKKHNHLFGRRLNAKRAASLVAEPHADATHPRSGLAAPHPRGEADGGAKGSKI